MPYSTKTQVRNRCGLTTTDVDDTTLDQHIAEADAEIELITGRKYTNSNSQTDNLGPFPRDMFGNKTKQLLLTQYPVQTVTSVQILNKDETVNTTVASTDYWLNSEAGIITLKDNAAVEYPRSVKVIYTYGISAVPTYVTQLSECIAGIKAWVKFLGGNYNVLNQYELPEMSFNQGDFYARGKQMIDMLRAEADMILNTIGRRQNTVMSASGWSTPTGAVGGYPGIKE